MAGRGLCFVRLGTAVSNPLSVVLAVALAMVLMPGIAAAGTVKGTVTNGTTGKIAVGVDVILIELQGGMQTVANTKTDDKGEYHFTYPQLGTSPMLIRVVYKGVNYHQPCLLYTSRCV